MGYSSTSIYFVLIITTFQFQLIRAPPPQEQQQVPETFDFVIVGGGTAGCALARRLSDSGEHSVLVLEAGIIPDPGLDVPALASSFLSNPNYARTYYSIPQRNADLENGGITTYRVGRTLGGSSSVNSMHFNRGNANDYNTWAAITGDRSWRYENLMKYFRRTENYAGIFPSNQHGQDGPITVSLPKYVPLLNEWLSAGRFLRYPVADPNGPQRISFCPAEYSKRLGRRVSSYTGYLKPVLGSRPNLRVVLRAEARRVIFNGNQAVGVQFRSNVDGIPIDSVVYARKEIIISAGAIETPALLLKSGIGPKNVLDAARIRPVKYLNVGQNLQDHVAVRLDFVIKNRSLAFIQERDLNPRTLRYFNEVGDGPYAAYSGFGGQAFISTTGQGNLTNIPDIQLFHLVSPGVPVLYPERPNIQTAEWEVSTSAFVLVANPLSRGSLSLNLTDVNSSPVIDFQYLTHPTDMRVMIDGMEMAMKIFENTPQFRRLGARFPPNQFPPCGRLQFRSRPYWECHAKQSATSFMHASGTCAMGSGADDPLAVVDNQLRVIGIRGLRVVDASIMPTITNANLQAAVYVTAEKASDMILRQWQNSRI
ncbi:unnamed protein product [Orchesella dallaii]|uniref:Glucose-methanol-choline oxidoreductase N-terminal domain-containing protein n=1 Tax=Orchesella dallaii TaxID=48710 RepID=A0ABP1PQJ0_9HEXA